MDNTHKYINNRDEKFIEKYNGSFEEFTREAEVWIDYIKAKGATQEELHALSMVLGMLPNEACKTKNVPSIGLIDESIADEIDWLNAHGYETLASCSGNPDEHEAGRVNGKGYINFLDRIENRELIENLCSSDEDWKAFRPELSFCYFKPSIHIEFDGEHLKKLKAFIEEMKSTITKMSMEECISQRKEDNELTNVSYSVTTPECCDIETNENIKVFISLLDKYGIGYKVADTVMGSYNLNKSWVSTDTPIPAAVEYCGTYPAYWDIEDVYLLDKMEKDGKLVINVYWIEDDGSITPNN